MAQNFGCPSCGAPLDYTGNGASTISCPYCYTSVIVPQELRSQRSEPVSPGMTMSLAGQAPKLRELSNLVRAKQRDQAVAMYQQVYGASLGDAQRLVDQLMQGSPMVITSSILGSASVVNISTPAGNFTVNQTPPIPGMPMAYPVPPPMTVYASSAPQATRRWLWYFGCLFAFIIFITLVTTIVPLIGVLIPLWFAFK